MASLDSPAEVSFNFLRIFIQHSMWFGFILKISRIKITARASNIGLPTR